MCWPVDFLYLGNEKITRQKKRINKLTNPSLIVGTKVIKRCLQV